MMRWMLSTILLLGITAYAFNAEGDEAVWRAAQHAPRVQPELLWVGTFGGTGDQWLEQIRFHRGMIQATSGGSRPAFGVQVRFDDDGAIEDVRSAGNPNQQMEVRTAWSDGGKIDNVEYGYRQVHRILQQPFMRGPDWELWGWGYGQANSSSNMADSRIRHALKAPNDDIIAIGWTDGGNSVFRRDPKDLSQGLGARMGIGNRETTGGGRGASSWVFRIDQQGEVQKAMVFRGGIHTAVWDEWGRIIVGGSGVFQPRAGIFPQYGDGAGIIMADRSWDRMLFRAHVAGTKPDAGPRASAQVWGMAIDNERGLLAICGWVEGAMAVTDSEELKHSQDKDAFLAIMRLWSPEDYTTAVGKETP
ncbi:MAG: hypothetical protein EA401_04020 [Planctomycetota bacterium]|nr:MAG: hypothetical protein EA401_04020 [Planctomycetota bacterium]